MPPVDTPMERPGKLESHWNSGPWVKATSRPIRIPREALNAGSRCQLSSMKPGLGTTTSVRGDSHAAGKEATTINNTARKSEYGARRSIGRLPAVCASAEINLDKVLAKIKATPNVTIFSVGTGQAARITGNARTGMFGPKEID